MWQELINLINDSTISGIIASFFGNTLSAPVSDGLRKLFKKKQKEEELTIESCKQTGIKEEDLKAIIEEIKRLKNDTIDISQMNEEGKNNHSISGLSNANVGIKISQINKKGDNNLNISF